MPTSPRSFQNEFRKNAKTDDIYKQRKDMVKRDDINEERKKKIILWTTFYRRNIHRFAEDYMNIKLYPYQIIWLYLMSISDVFVAICSRAAAKSYLVTVYTTAIAILYPKSEIIVGAGSIKQAGIIVSEKLTSLRNNSPNLQREITNITANLNNYEARFVNGSSIRVVPANENARGNRATYLVIDEFRVISKEIVDAIFTPFLYARQADYLRLPEYSNLIEEPRKIFISSAYFKTEWWYDTTREIIKMVAAGKSAGFLALDYLISLKHGIKTKNQIESERKIADPVTFAMEYLNEPMGESGSAYFKIKFFPRNLKKAFYPLRDDLLNSKKNPYAIPKLKDEIRILAVDIASRANVSNDNSIIACIRLIPTHKGYKRSLVYLESSHGSNVIKQGLRIKEIYFDFDSDYLVLDMQGVGISVYDSMSSLTRNDDRNIEYPPFGVAEFPEIDEKVFTELRDRTLGINPLPVVFPVSATSKLNSDIAVAFRSSLQKKLWEFLQTDTDQEDYLLKTNKEFLEMKDDISLRTWLLHPHAQTNLLIQECINLDMSMISGNIKLTEPVSGRKDRYSSVSYGNWFISSVLDKRLLKEANPISDYDAIASITFVL